MRSHCHTGREGSHGGRLSGQHGGRHSGRRRAFAEVMFAMGGPGGWSDFGRDFGRGFGADFPGGPRGGPGGPGGPRGRRRMFGGGELRLVLLKLIADEPRHGYQLIKAIEDLTGGDYAPSPGIVYPSLSMLEDLGFVTEAHSPESKRTFQATDEGRAHLAENQAEADKLLDRLAAMDQGKTQQRPEIGRAIGNMMHALKNRVSRDGWNEALLNEVVDILDEAAKKIERLD
ncbi:MAG: PadR family transcriptional regulator [Sphingomonas bacterium]|nr:PadR family transcriptional regulator [Sphingomonas bacterium]